MKNTRRWICFFLSILLLCSCLPQLGMITSASDPVEFLEGRAYLDTSWGDDEYMLNLSIHNSQPLSDCGIVYLRDDAGNSLSGLDSFHKGYLEPGVWNALFCIYCIYEDGAHGDLIEGNTYYWQGYAVSGGRTYYSPQYSFVFSRAGTRYHITSDSGTCGDGVSWTLDIDGVLTIYGSGEMTDYTTNGSQSSAPWDAYRDMISTVVVGSGVTHIGDHAFSSYSDLGHVKIQNKSCTINQSFGDTLGTPENTVIHGHKDSAVQQYADKYGYEFVLLFETDFDDPDPVNLSDEILHLIFADMAYARIPSSYKNKGKTVSEWIDDELEKEDSDPKTHEAFSQDPVYGYDYEEMMQKLFRKENGEEDEMSRLDVYRMVGDWVILDVINGQVGYAANVFQKGDDIIIAYRGSEGGPQSILSGEDWWVDAEFAVFNSLDSRQFGDTDPNHGAEYGALNTYNAYAERGNVTVTGHSLGGALVTYVSTMTGVKGYSFDGAAGHVIDLVYLYEPMNIDFHSKDKMTFTNYTDPKREDRFGADLIQHTNEDLFPGICYKTNNLAINYFAMYGELFWTHQPYSNTKPGKDNKTLEFNETAETHSPKANWYASADYRNLGILTGGVAGALAAGIHFGGIRAVLPGGIVGGAAGHYISRLLKNGSVHLGTVRDDEISVLNNISSIWDVSAATTENVLYGGDGSDTLIGAAGTDVLIPGALNSDLLSGGLGNDVYLLDVAKAGNIYLNDYKGDDVIRLKNDDGITQSSITAIGYDEFSKSYGFSLGGNRTIYLGKTLLSHSFRVLNSGGKEICKIDTKGKLTKTKQSETAALHKAAETPECKEISIAGSCLIQVYDPEGTLVAEYNTEEPGFYSEEFGSAFVSQSDDGPLFTATIYENYMLQASGEQSVAVAVVGDDEDGCVNRVTVANTVDLSVNDASIKPDEHLVIQGEQIAEAEERVFSVAVDLDCNEKALLVGERWDQNRRRVLDERRPCSGFLPTQPGRDLQLDSRRTGRDGDLRRGGRQRHLRDMHGDRFRSAAPTQ